MQEIKRFMSKTCETTKDVTNNGTLAGQYFSIHLQIPGLKSMVQALFMLPHNSNVPTRHPLTHKWMPSDRRMNICHCRLRFRFSKLKILQWSGSRMQIAQWTLCSLRCKSFSSNFSSLEFLSAGSKGDALKQILTALYVSVWNKKYLCNLLTASHCIYWMIILNVKLNPKEQILYCIPHGDWHMSQRCWSTIKWSVSMWSGWKKIPQLHFEGIVSIHVLFTQKY